MVGIKKRRRSLSHISDRLPFAKSEKADDSSVIPHESSRPRIERSNGGDARLQIVFPAVIHRDKPFKLDVSEFLEAPNLAEVFAYGLMTVIGARPLPSTADTYRGSLVNGIVKFLKEQSLNFIAIENIDSSLVNRFIVWLNGESENKKTRAISARADFYLMFRRVMDSLRVESHWSGKIRQDLNFRNNPWPGRRNARMSRDILDDDLMTRIRLSAISEVNDITSRACDGWNKLNSREYAEVEIFESPRDEISAGDFPITFYLVLSAHELCNGPLPSEGNLSSTTRKLMRAYGISYSDASAALRPTVRALVPFAILLAMATAYNADVTRNITINDFRYSSVLGRKIAFYPGAATDSNEIAFEERVTKGEIQLGAYKGRSDSKQRVYIPVDDKLDNPSMIVDFLTFWTKQIREHAPSAIRNLLFIYAPQTGGVKITSFYGPHGDGSSTNWEKALADFRKLHNLEHFSLENIRPTILDLTRREFGGDIRAASVQANHVHESTTAVSYTSAAEKARQYQSLGLVHEKRSRYVETSGTIDSRDFPEEVDTSCATPGWSCADIYDSPFTSPGKLCAAYGRCPDCYLGGTDLNSPLSYAYSINLLDAINRAQTTMTPLAWLNRWVPVRQKLIEKWLPSFSAKAVREARMLDIPPMVLPE